MVNRFACTCPQNYQQVHDQTRVDAGSQYGYAVLLSDFVQLLSQFRFLSLRISHFFCRSDYVHAGFHNLNQLVINFSSEGVGADNNDVSSTRFDYFVSSSDDNVFSVASFNTRNYFVQALAQLSADVDSANDVNALLLCQHLADSAAHSAKSPQDYFYIFHFRSLLLSKNLIFRILCL